MTLMIRSKVLTDAAWKDVLAKNKAVKDNGMLKALADIKKLGDDDHDGAQKTLDDIVKLMVQLKKSKEASTPAVGKFLAELSSAADVAMKDIAKAKAEAEKKTKAEAEAKKQQEKKAADEDEDDDEAGPAILTTKLLPLLRQVNKGEIMHTLVARAGKQVAVMLSRKPISPARRKILAEQLGGASGIKYYTGQCVKEGGATTFALNAEVSGLSKLLKLALLNQTGQRVKKIACRGNDGDDSDEDDDDDEGGGGGQRYALGEKGGDEQRYAMGEDSAPSKPRHEEKVGGDTAEPAIAAVRPFELMAAVGRGGKNDPEDVKFVQTALNRRADAGLKVDGRLGRDTMEAIVEFQRALGQSRPDGRVEPGRGTARALSASGKIGKPPPPPDPKAPPEDLGEPTLGRAPQVWYGTRGILEHNIGELKRAIRQEYANEHPALLAEIDHNVKRVDGILQKLDTRLSQSLERAGKTKNPAERKAEIDAAKKILAEYVGFVKQEPLINHIDSNPFGVNAQVRKTISQSLTHMIKSIS